MDKNDIKKKYTNGEVTVIWQPGLCRHSGVCVRNLPSVFHPKENPWIKIENAASAEIIATVKKCPSGALTIEENNFAK